MLKNKYFVVILVFLLLFIVITGCSTDSTPTVNPNEEPSNQEDNATGDTAQQDANNNKDSENDKETEDTEEPANNEDTSDTDEKEVTLYAKVKSLSIRSEASPTSGVISQLSKGTELKPVEEVTNSEDGSIWYKVVAKKDESDIEGYVLAEETVNSKIELLQTVFPDLDYAPQDKTFEYEDNPRVEVRGIYVTKHTASGKRLDELIEMAKRTNINTFVIDVKDDHGALLFYSETAQKYSPKANDIVYIKDMETFMKKLKDNNIYTIARIVSFKDNLYAERYPEKAITYRDNGTFFTNSDKLIWISPHDRDMWEYNIGVAKEAAKWGFNEIQFDYVRFPASNNGKLDSKVDYKNNLNESKPKTIQEYLKYARKELSPLHVYISADIYGMVGTTKDDMALGQYWEAVSNIVDYVSPMMYPSHYGYGEYKIPVPDAEPYKTIYLSTKDSVERNKNIETPATIRPWIQDFTATWVKGYIKYGVEEIQAQIKALEDNGVTEYMLWNPNNKYTEDALK